MNRKQQDDNLELQQVGAYGTKHKTHQTDVPLLEERPEDEVRRGMETGPDVRNS